jgi:hypothetical protein
MSQDPYTGYGNQPQNPYPYGTPQNSYQAPPGPYATPDPYGYGQQQQSYGYVPPQATPLPLEQAIKELPNQYVKVVTKPSAATLAQEMGKASWDIVWVQLVGYAIIVAILSYIRSFIMSNPFNMIGTTTLNPIMAPLIQWGFTLGLAPLTIIGFFIGTGIVYLIAKAFGGQGTFLTQAYTNLLFAVPLGILSGLASLVPILGVIVAFGLSIYSVVLNVFSVMAVHRLSGGKATAVVLIPAVIVFVLLILVIIGVIVAAAAMG